MTYNFSANTQELFPYPAKTSDLHWLLIQGNHFIRYQQQHYHATTAQWQALWHNIEQMNHHPCYAGCLTAFQKDVDKYEIIDVYGQLTTLLIVIQAVLHALKNIKTHPFNITFNLIPRRHTYDYIRLQLLKSLDPLTAEGQNRFTFNQENNDFFNQLAVCHPHEIDPASLSPSNRLMFEAFQFFIAKLDPHFPKSATSKDYGAFVEKLTTQFRFTFIGVKKGVEADAVAQTLAGQYELKRVQNNLHSLHP